VGESAWHAAEPVPTDDPDGWLHLRLRLDWPHEADRRLLPLGDAAEVLEPPELRERITEAARAVLTRYAAPSGPPLVGAGASP
jgi:predicted DNA-binding transcriptional regulator YafY